MVTVSYYSCIGHRSNGGPLDQEISAKQETELLLTGSCAAKCATVRTCIVQYCIYQHIADVLLLYVQRRSGQSQYKQFALLFRWRSE